MLALILSGVVLAPSVEDITERFSMMKVKPLLLSKVASKFESIRQGSFISVAEFRKLFPLEKLMKKKPDLFQRSDGSNAIDDLAGDLCVSRDEAVDNFIAQNYHQINTALRKMLGSTNDAVIAAVLIDPLGATEAHFLYPIVELIDDYIRVRSRRCLLDFLPDVFEDQVVYDTYFTPIDGYRVIPRDDIGYLAIVPDDPLSRMIREHGGRWLSRARDGVIWFHVDPNDIPPVSALIDVRKGCAVAVNNPYQFGNFINLDNWLVLHNKQRGSTLIWRKDSVTPLTLSSTYFRITGDLSTVVSDDGYTLPIDPNVPFVATRAAQEVSDQVFSWFTGDLLPLEVFVVWTLVGDDGSLAVFSEALVNKYRRLSAELYAALLEKVGCSLQKLKNRLEGVSEHIRAVYSVINLLQRGVYHEAWLMALELCARFNLKSMDELVEFIVATVHGYRRVGVELVLPVRFISSEERMRQVGTLQDLGLMVVKDRARRSFRHYVAHPWRSFTRYASRHPEEIGRNLLIFLCLHCCGFAIGAWMSTCRVTDHLATYISRKVRETLETGSLY